MHLVYLTHALRVLSREMRHRSRSARDENRIQYISERAACAKHGVRQCCRVGVQTLRHTVIAVGTGCLDEEVRCYSSYKHPVIEERRVDMIGISCRAGDWAAGQRMLAETSDIWQELADDCAKSRDDLRRTQT